MTWLKTLQNNRFYFLFLSLSCEYVCILRKTELCDFVSVMDRYHHKANVSWHYRARYTNIISIKGLNNCLWGNIPYSHNSNIKFYHSAQKSVQNNHTTHVQPCECKITDSWPTWMWTMKKRTQEKCGEKNKHIEFMSFEQKDGAISYN